jgi:hypothetical protein
MARYLDDEWLSLALAASQTMAGDSSLPSVTIRWDVIDSPAGTFSIVMKIERGRISDYVRVIGDSSPSDIRFAQSYDTMVDIYHRNTTSLVDAIYG